MTLLELFDLLRRRLSLLIAIPVLFAAVTAAWAMMLPPVYTASTTMYVLTENDKEQTLTQNDLNIGSMITNDTIQIMNSARAAKEVAQKLGLDDLKGYRLSTTRRESTRIIVATVTSTNQDGVADVANAYAEVTSEIATEVMGVKAVNIVDEATRPNSSSGPRRLLYIVAGALAGLVAAIGLILLIDLLDTRVRTSEIAEEIAKTTVIGRFPKVERG